MATINVNSKQSNWMLKVQLITSKTFRLLRKLKWDSIKAIRDADDCTVEHLIAMIFISQLIMKFGDY